MSSASEAFVYDAIRTPRGQGKSDGSRHSVKPLDLVTGALAERYGERLRPTPWLVDKAKSGEGFPA